MATHEDVDPDDRDIWLGRYLVLEELGRGGMGVVTRAYDPELERGVALKVVRTDRATASYQARLVREAQAMARLSHPNVVQVYGVEFRPCDTRGIVLVMEYVRGANLAEWIDSHRPRPAEILDLLTQAGRGLAAAHDRGLLHRDFKFDNVLVGDDGRARVTDFGLARLRGVDSSMEHTNWDSEVDPGGLPSEVPPPEVPTGLHAQLTEEGTVLGTPRYMPLEQLCGQQLDARSDQYAFCVTAWRALTGRWPFEGGSAAMLRAKRSLPRMPSRSAGVSRHVLEALRRGLQPDPAKRWPHMDDLLAVLGNDPARRRRWLVTGALALAVVGASLGWTRLDRARALADCDDRSTEIAAVWNEGRSASIERELAALGADYALEAWARSEAPLDEYASAWQRSYAHVCRRSVRHGDQGRGETRASLACLEDQRNVLNELLRQFTAPDDGVLQNVGAAVTSLPRLEQCSDPAWLRLNATAPDDPAIERRVASLRAELARAWALSNVARYPAALETAQAVLTQAEALGWVPLTAEARMAVADATDEVGDYGEAARLSEQTYFEAEAAGYDMVALEASTELVFILAHRLRRPDEAFRWGRRAQTIVDRLGLQDDLAVSQLLANLAVAHMSVGELSEAIRLNERALAIREAALGPDHPEVGVIVGNLGTTLQAAGEIGASKRYQERALRIRRAALGDRHIRVAGALQNLAGVYAMLKEWQQAEAAYREAIEILENAPHEDPAWVAANVSGLAGVFMYQEKYEQAEETYREAQRIVEGSTDPRDPARSYPLVGRARVALYTDRPEMALPLAERALRLREGGDLPAGYLAQARMAVANALVQTQRSPDRAILLARQALEEFEAAPDAWDASREDARRFLAEHDASP